ncbi:ABC transporter permease [Paenibacillus sp. YN15]|uniref:ABC transporter permease n=1 Tax=Paenibacillus sp. YN15 TaxID=1742774 RepID=UPI000DCB0D34|nr:ABC transporter permease [Paenibacillus sp. YN15]RAU96368.1 ABC transporter permease [Paenibacillus sp. YN15]
MPVFNLCLKIIKKNLPSISIYVIIFLVISTLITVSNVNQQTQGFSQTKAKIAFLAEESTPLVEGFKEELSKTNQLVELPDEKEKLQDALFFRDVTYILRIPAGFTGSFLQGGGLQLQKTVVPGSMENIYVDLTVNQYWRLAALHSQNSPGISQEETVLRVAKDMAANTEVNISNSGGKKDISQSFSVYYFNFLAYTLTSVLILGVSAIMIVFNNRDLSRRNFCSPLPAGSINLQFFLANLVFTGAAWILMTGACFIFDPKDALTQNMIYLLLNSLVFTLCLASASFLIGNLVKSRNAISAIANVASLGPAFISGVFVPQEFLASPVLRLASFTPTYWYVQANSKIGSLTDFSWSSLSPVFNNMLITAGFALAFFAISMVVAKRNRLRA